MGSWRGWTNAWSCRELQAAPVLVTLVSGCWLIGGETKCLSGCSTTSFRLVASPCCINLLANVSMAWSEPRHAGWLWHMGPRSRCCLRLPTLLVLASPPATCGSWLWSSRSYAKWDFCVSHTCRLQWLNWNLMHLSSTTGFMWVSGNCISHK